MRTPWVYCGSVRYPTRPSFAPRLIDRKAEVSRAELMPGKRRHAARASHTSRDPMEVASGLLTGSFVPCPAAVRPAPLRALYFRNEPLVRAFAVAAREPPKFVGRRLVPAADVDSSDRRLDALATLPGKVSALAKAEVTAASIARRSGHILVGDSAGWRRAHSQSPMAKAQRTCSAKGSAVSTRSRPSRGARLPA